MLKRRRAETRFKEIGESLRTALNQAIAEAGLDGACTGLSVNPALTLNLPAEVDGGQVSTLFIQEMAKRGVHCYLGFKATLAHTEDDIRLTAIAATEALSIIKFGLDRGNLDDLLEADLKQEPFRRLVR